MKTLNSKLASIQSQLAAPKGQRNAFGNYNYRSCEDIVEAVKPLLDGLTLIISDEVVLIGDRYYIKAISTISDGEHSISTSAYAREPEIKKGMDVAQISGATSSYSRKYSLNGLFAIDDTKDADTAAPEKPTQKAKIVFASQKLSQALIGSVKGISDSIASGDYSVALEFWSELSVEEKQEIWVAPSKGGHFTTAERAIMQSTDFKNGVVK